MKPTDMTSAEEYNRLLDVLPLHIQKLVRPNIHLIDEIILDPTQNLRLKYDGLRIEYPLPIYTKDITYVASHLAGKFRDDGRQGINGTLHRISCEFDEEGIPNAITIRVARAMMGVAEPLRHYIEHAEGIAVIGPPGVGKTTLLRDVARIKAEILGTGLVVIDSSNEITGDGEEAHRMLSRIRRVKVGDPRQQAPKLNRAIRNMGPEEILMDEVGYNGDVPLLETASHAGVTVIATMHGKILDDVVRNARLNVLLGVSRDATSGKLERLEKPCFSTAFEVHGKGKYMVYTDVADAVTRLLAGEHVEGVKVGNWPELTAHVI